MSSRNFSTGPTQPSLPDSRLCPPPPTPTGGNSFSASSPSRPSASCCASVNLVLPLLLLGLLLLARAWSRERDLPGAFAAGLVLGLATLARSVAYPLFLLWPLSGAALRPPRKKRWTSLAVETLLLL